MKVAKVKSWEEREVKSKEDINVEGEKAESNKARKADGS